jgi:predicted nucleic acid-binding protein
MTLVFNASPLIVLSKAGLLDDFLLLADRVLIPEPVAQEISRAEDPSDPARLWIARRSGLIHPSPSVSPFVLAWDLGAGESSVISLASAYPESIAVLDDLAARRCTQAVGLRMTGTLGLILMAKRARIIPSATTALDAVISAGLFISPHHIDLIRRSAGE